MAGPTTKKKTSKSKITKKKSKASKKPFKENQVQPLELKEKAENSERNEEVESILENNVNHEIISIDRNEHLEDNSFFMVGIGASAGGFEALKSFFTALPADSGMAFVVIQHLSPDSKSYWQELLQKVSLIPILQAEDGLQVEPNNAYLIPPKQFITVFHNKILLSEINQKDVNPYFPINVFLLSLAQDLGEKAIGIILSGTGSDGTIGIRAIKEAGGMVIVQDEESAKFIGMPHSAISTSLVDFVCPPEKMPDVLLHNIQRPLAKIKVELENLPLTDQEYFVKILALVRSKTNVDFLNYKKKTVIRRLQKRMAINLIPNFEKYYQLLGQYPKELEILFGELLIGVTSFYRDPAAFEVIAKNAIPKIFETKKDEKEIRVWVVGCATGEETYSLAILFKEYMEEIKENYNIKIFATDIEKQALQIAGEGIYSEGVVADLSPERLNRYFTKKGSKYQIIDSIRKMIIFAPHNIITDPPFSKIDLISCRNLLIYLNIEIQKRVLSLFHFALIPQGILFLGSSESLGELASLFAPLDNKWKIFQYKGGSQSLAFQNFKPFNIPPRSDLIKSNPRIQDLLSMSDLSNELQEKIIHLYLPPAIIINEDLDILQVINDVNNYLKIPAGKIKLNILDMARPEVTAILSAAIHSSINGNTKISYPNLSINSEGNLERFNLIVEPIELTKFDSRFLLIIFEPIIEDLISSEEGPVNLESSVNREIIDLEQGLRETRENLKTARQEFDTMTQEANAMNEELVAANEELQSTNEELQSTNEELQSVNEELRSMNSEYQEKVDELTQLNNDMNNLVVNTGVGIIFLDKNLKIRKFSPLMYNEINLISTDVGRPISDIANNFKYENFYQDITEVNQSLVGKEIEAQSKFNNWYLIRIVPYKSSLNTFDGVVIIFININDLKKASLQ